MVTTVDTMGMEASYTIPITRMANQMAIGWSACPAVSISLVAAAIRIDYSDYLQTGQILYAKYDHSKDLLYFCVKF